MFKIPYFIDIFLNDNSFEFIDLIQNSDWKKTYILKIRKDNEYFILKAYSEDTPKNIKKKLISEIQFYQNNSKEYLPKLILNTENILILEYIDGVTLREALIKNEITEEIIEDLFIDIGKLYSDNKKIINKHAIYDFYNAFSHLSALKQSGPIQTKNIKVSFIKKVINKLELFILKYKLKIVINDINIDKLQNGFVHGDFHYNNILISNGKIKFIDFENIKYDGFFDFDILYLIVMMEVFIEKDSFQIKTIFKAELEKFLSKNLNLIKIYDLYKTAISSNEKFHVRLLQANTQ